MTIMSCEFESHFLHHFAEIAQLVEHNLAKVRVASSSLVFRSKKVLHVRHWKGGRVVDYSGLENRRAERHRGFESLSSHKEQTKQKGVESSTPFVFVACGASLLADTRL